MWTLLSVLYFIEVQIVPLDLEKRGGGEECKILLVTKKRKELSTPGNQTKKNISQKGKDENKKTLSIKSGHRIPLIPYQSKAHESRKAGTREN